MNMRSGEGRPDMSRVVVSKSTPEQKARAAALHAQARENKAPLEMGSAEDEAEATPDIAPPMLMDEGPVENLAAKAPEKPKEIPKETAVKAEKAPERPDALESLGKVDISEGYSQVGEQPAGEKPLTPIEAAKKRALEAYGDQQESAA